MIYKKKQKDSYNVNRIEMGRFNSFSIFYLYILEWWIYKFV